MTASVERAPAATGLTAAEVAERVAQGQVNAVAEHTSRSFAHIVRANVFTRFNAILGTLLVVVLIAGAWQDATFGIIMIANALIGIVQETRAKRTLDRLAVLSAPKARVRRSGESHELPVGDVVLDDVIELATGDQIAVDGVVLESDLLEIDESLLTGESEPIVKAPRDEVLSGSFVVAGRGLIRANAVGADAYARRITADAKRFALTRSELMAGINTLLRYITWALVVVGPILIWSELRSEASWREAVTGAAAGLVGMVPEGLVLLTSMAFLVAALRLGRKKVLVQELPAVEVLARVDTVCLDKTGTLTDGQIGFGRYEPLAPADPRTELVPAALGALADEPGPNSTLRAIAGAFEPPSGWRRTAAVAFSSARKWSGVTFADRGTWLIGAPEIVLADRPDDDPVRQKSNTLAAGGQRVLVLATSDLPLGPTPVLPPLDPLALLLFDERVRPDAAETLAYFIDQDINPKVISGDNPRTIGAVAARVALPGAERVVDARELPEDGAALADAVESASVFGRVTPQQKRGMVKALQSRGHVVAMTGDGVNDALALKDADLGVAMGSGAAATRGVAQLVLVDDRFAKLPNVVAEGRRVMANVERVATLFVMKNVWSAVLSLAVAVAGFPYPFLPRQLSLISVLTVGIPAFFLALVPNPRRYQPGFLRRVLKLSIPAGVLVGLGIFASYAFARVLRLPREEASTAACVTTMIIGLWVLVILGRSLYLWKIGLVLAMAGLFLLVLLVPVARDYFELSIPLRGLGEAALIGVAVSVLISVWWRIALRGESRAAAQAVGGR